MKELKVLVIYELIPEETKTTIVTMTEEEYSFFKKAHNSFINAGDYDNDVYEANAVISNALTNNTKYKGYCETDMQRKYFGEFVPDKDLDIEDLSGVDRLIHCGFHL